MCPDDSKGIGLICTRQYLCMKARVRKSLKEQLRVSGGSMELHYDSSGVTQHTSINGIEDGELRTLAINLQKITGIGQRLIDRNRRYINMVREFLPAADLTAYECVPS